MVKKMNNKPTIDDLKKHLFKYKDATVIVGNETILEKEMFLPYSDTTDYSRKSMVKTPKEFWNFYEEKVYKSINVIPKIINDSNS